MSYYDRLAKVIQEESGNVGKAQFTEDSAQMLDSNKIQELQEKAGEIQGKLGENIGELIAGKMAGKLLLKKFGKPLVDRALASNRKALESKSEQAQEKIGDLSQESDDILTRGAGRLSSLPATDPGLTIRSTLPQDLNLRDGDITPESIVRGENTLGDIRANNRARFSNLDENAKGEATDKINSNPEWRSQGDVAQDVRSGNITADEASSQMLKSRMIEQDAIGEAEGGSSTVLGATPYTGTTVYGAGRREITSSMADDPDPLRVGFSRTSGLTTAEESRLGAIPGEAMDAGKAVLGAGEKTFAETAMDIIPGVGEAIGIFTALGEGIKQAVDAHRDQIQDAKQTAMTEGAERQAQLYSGFNRPSFGSMALPSFDTSKGGSALLQE